MHEPAQRPGNRARTATGVNTVKRGWHGPSRGCELITMAMINVGRVRLWPFTALSRNTHGYSMSTNSLPIKIGWSGASYRTLLMLDG